MRLATALLFAVVAAMASLSTSATATTVSAIASRHANSVVVRTVRVVHCPTQFGSTELPPAVPGAIKVLHAPKSLRGLVAYTNTDVYLVGPAGMNCSGIVAVDGGSALTIWPRGTRRPSLHSRTDGLSLDLEPACVGCMADAACPFFTVFASQGYPCTASVPTGERVVHYSPHVALFEDPPGVAGSGSPSGGPHPANGYVEIGRRTGVSRATCTLPQAQRWVCTVSLNDAITRYH